MRITINVDLVLELLNWNCGAPEPCSASSTSSSNDRNDRYLPLVVDDARMDLPDRAVSGPRVLPRLHGHVDLSVIFCAFGTLYLHASLHVWLRYGISTAAG